MAQLTRITQFLDRELRVAEFTDSSQNGVQVANSGKIRRVCCGVDASLEFFEAARQRGADLLICHHGISWSDSLKRITGLNYERVRCLIENDMALYACHLPLDAHPRYGNNALIARGLGLQRLKPFGLYNGSLIGFRGRFAKPVRYATLKRRVAQLMGQDIRSMDFGKKTVTTVAVVSGGGCDELAEAALQGIDVFVTGEPRLSAYIEAQEYGINAVFAGHYATEVFGVRALGNLIEKRFGIPAEFINLGVPY